MPIEIRDNKIFLIRPYEETVQVSGGANPFDWKFEKRNLVREDELDIPCIDVEVLYDCYSDVNSLNYSNTWLKNADNLFYISISRKGKDDFKPVIKKTSLKKQYLNEVAILDEYFAKTKTEVFYFGRKIKPADAASFEKITDTHFYQDKDCVYSFTTTNGLASIEISEADRFFIPHCWYFADREKVYHQSSWSENIEPISGKFDGQSKSHIHDVLIGNDRVKSMFGYDALWKELFGKISSYEELFAYFFPTVNAKWNN